MTLANAGGAGITLDVIEAIHQNASYLSEVDGETGDGDHGINMNKGFLLARGRISEDMSLSESLDELGDTLVMDIGGSMGPIYGTFFSTIAEDLAPVAEIDAPDFAKALADVVEALEDLAGAQPGDKTLIDTVAPAAGAFQTALDQGSSFKDCLAAMVAGAKEGMESTRQMQAKIGRAARLGPRSIGHLDAGATSCCIILSTMGTSMMARI